MDMLYKFEHCLKLIALENRESIILGDVNSEILSKDPAYIDIGKGSLLLIFFNMIN
jgi:hypothetical protein